MTFEEFWKLYPRKVGKFAAMKKWNKINEEDHPQILEKVTRLKDSIPTKEGGLKYVPHPSTWLNQGRWLDEEDELEKWVNS